LRLGFALVLKRAYEHLALGGHAFDYVLRDAVGQAELFDAENSICTPQLLVCNWDCTMFLDLNFDGVELELLLHRR